MVGVHNAVQLPGLSRFRRGWALFAVAALSIAPGVTPAAEPAPSSRVQTESAARADPDFALGKAYLYGDGVEQSDRKAFEIWSHAAASGNLDAKNGLGYLYENGRGAPRDPVRARALYTECAKEGSAKAQFNLARLLARGADGVERNLNEAIKWYEKSAAAGLVEAQVALGKIYYFGEMEGIPQDYEKAGRYIEAAANQGNAWAENALGALFEFGYARKQDFGEAAKWYRKAAEQNDGLAQANLGLLYIDGRGVEKDWTTAYMWLWCASYLDVPNGYNALSDFKRGVTREVQHEGIRRAKAFLESKGVKVVVPEE